MSGNDVGASQDSYLIGGTVGESPMVGGWSFTNGCLTCQWLVDVLMDHPEPHKRNRHSLREIRLIHHLVVTSWLMFFHLGPWVVFLKVMILRVLVLGGRTTQANGTISS